MICKNIYNVSFFYKNDMNAKVRKIEFIFMNSKKENGSHFDRKNINLFN